MNKIDKLIEELDKRTEKPVKNIFEMTISAYIDKNEMDYKKNVIFDEFMYHLLTDFMLGIESVIIEYNFEHELDLLKDIIAIDTTEKSKNLLQNYCKSIKTKTKNIPIPDRYAVERFLYISLCYIKIDYINILIEHMLITENKEVDEIIQIINGRVIANKTNILSIT